MRLLTKEENFECFQKKIRELGGDWARENRVRFTNYSYGGEKYFQSKAEITNLYKNEVNWHRAENFYIIYVEINNATQNITIRFHKDQPWENVYFSNFKDLKKYLETNNYLQMKITNEHRQENCY